ncbi:hypothetical protein [Oricola thermophila]|uniref:Uncharacterized protein n=1 Tax=Oricola thermophila TaxID=2742145 RepID=A0A6N1VKX7_9HYPH|nr:hypothetical protein [Oricola thermophila]QKV20052.1 hypothetical protein HTY61_17145 [Oricola thermophila]
MAQSREERLRRQRERQREYRRRLRAARKPSRDDIARAALHWAIRETMQDEQQLDRLGDRVIPILVAQGFDRKKCDEAFDELVERYRRGWDFQRRFPEDGDNGKDVVGGTKDGAT